MFSHCPSPYALRSPGNSSSSHGLTGKTGSHGDRPGKGLPNSDGFFMTVVILNDTQLVTMGRLYPQERPL
jgi:hypothetical protein